MRALLARAFGSESRHDLGRAIKACTEKQDHTHVIDKLMTSCKLEQLSNTAMYQNAHESATCEVTTTCSLLLETGPKYPTTTFGNRHLSSRRDLHPNVLSTLSPGPNNIAAATTQVPDVFPDTKRDSTRNHSLRKISSR